MKTEADRKAGANKHVSAVLAGASLYLVSAPVFQHLFLIGALLSVCVTLAKSWPVRFLIGVVVTGVVYILEAKNWRDLVLGVYSLACTAIGIVCAVVSFIVVALLPRLMLSTLILLLFAVVVLLVRLDPPRFSQRADGAVAIT
jgi:hypothetical protein